MIEKEARAILGGKRISPAGLDEPVPTDALAEPVKREILASRLASAREAISRRWMRSTGGVNEAMLETGVDVWREREVALVRGSGRLSRRDRDSRSDEFVPQATFAGGVRSAFVLRAVDEMSPFAATVSVVDDQGGCGVWVSLSIRSGGGRERWAR